MLRMTAAVHAEMVAHCLDGLPLEACGLLGGEAGDDATAVACYPARNAAASAKLYEVDGRDQMRAEADADDRGIAIVGVFHSHTHTEAYPSPTDVRNASTPLSDPSWHYVLVSLREMTPAVRSFRILDGKIVEEPLVVD